MLDIIYDNTGKPYALNYDGTVYYYVLNLQGDVISIVSRWGSTEGRYTYDAWGNLLAVSGDIAYLNPIRYRGYYYDSETRLYYLGSRYYDPQVKRFVNADGYTSVGQGYLGYNMFAYCKNSPINYCDSGGSRPALCVADTGHAPPMVKDKLRRLEAKELVYNTVLSESTTTKGKKTVHAALNSKYYSHFSSDYRVLQYYSDYLEQYIIDSYTSPASDYEFLSSSHIKKEMEAHYIVWDILTDWGLEETFPGVYNSVDVADINADESRFSVRFLMEFFSLMGG